MNYFCFVTIHAVCVKFLGKFKKTLEAEGIEKEPQIKAKLQEVCKAAVGKDNKFVSFYFSFYKEGCGHIFVYLMMVAKAV